VCEQNSMTKCNFSGDWKAHLRCVQRETGHTHTHARQKESHRQTRTNTHTQTPNTLTRTVALLIRCEQAGVNTWVCEQNAAHSMTKFSLRGDWKAHLRGVNKRVWTLRCQKIDRSHTHTPTENNTPDTDTDTHTTRTAPHIPKRTPPTNT